MRNLCLFLIRYNDIFGFILFVVTSIILVVRHNNFQRSSFISSSNVVIGSYYQQVNSWKSYLSLHETNEELAAENGALRQQIQNLLQVDTTADTIRIIDSIEQGRYAFIVANVANNSVHKKNNRSEEHTSELQSRENLVCRLLLEKKKQKKNPSTQ